MSKYASELANSLVPYVAGEQPQDRKYIKLNTNENPYPPCAGVQSALSQYDGARLRLYSDPDNKELKSAIAEVEGVDSSEVFVGNGSDEVLAMCFPAFCEKKAVFADITYSFYEVYCNLFGKEKKIIPLLGDFSADKDAYCHTDGDMVIITNPNAPTGISMSIRDIEDIVANNSDKLVLIDEAYSAFAGESATGLIAKYDNLLVVKTFSKAYSLAGARCGYALGNLRLIDDLNKVKNSFNSYTVNCITEKLASIAILDREYLNCTVNKVINTRETARERLTALGFEVLPSGANFLFARHSEAPAETIYLALKKRGILVRYFNKPRIDNFLRITIGTDEDMQALYSALKDITN